MCVGGGGGGSDNLCRDPAVLGAPINCSISAVIHR